MKHVRVERRPSMPVLSILSSVKQPHTDQLVVPLVPRIGRATWRRRSEPVCNNQATHSMADASYFQKDSGAASRYLPVHNEGGSAFTYHCERFRTQATDTRSCPRQCREILRRL